MDRPTTSTDPAVTRLHRLAETVEQVKQTSSRKAKGELLAELLRTIGPDEIVPTIGFVLAKPRQGAIGVGWATVAALDTEERSANGFGGGETGEPGEPVPEPTVLGLDTLLSEVMATTGEGSQAARTNLVNRFLASCDATEVEFVKRVLIGEARQGALAGVLTDAAAKAAGVKVAAMRRAAMLQGDLAEAARTALVEGSDALEQIDLVVKRPIQPMLASTAADVGEALEALGSQAAVEWKFDGVRIQVHVSDGRPSIYTRNLNPVTDRLAVVHHVAARLHCQSAVLDGEVLGFFGENESPQPFQDTMSTFGTRASPSSSSSGERAAPSPSSSSDHTASLGLRPYFFDLMYLDGQSLIDRPLIERAEALQDLAERSGLSEHLIPRIFTDDPETAQQQLDEALAAGHEGVMIKAAGGVYEAGRRGKSWRKVKPVHTLDLVVLGAEWGHGRRQGWLSNLHLGARHPETDEFVMVGKTFKGLTDDLLRWQTEQFLTRKLNEDRQPGRHAVMIKQDMVVEIALDGAQTSTRYPGGVALRFARVRRYRDDKDPTEADTLDAIRRLL